MFRGWGGACTSCDAHREITWDVRCRLLFVGASLPPHCHGFPHPSAPFLTPVLSGTELTRDRWSFVRLGLKVAIADINAAALETLAKELVAAHGETNVLAMLTDVSKLEDVVRLRERVYEAWGEVSVVRRGLPSPPYLPSPFPSPSPSPSTFCDSSEEKGSSFPLLLCPAVALSPCPHP
jgi:hypothetical protein